MSREEETYKRAIRNINILEIFGNKPTKELIKELPKEVLIEIAYILFYENVDYKQEIERLQSIIKEVREYIEEHSEMTDLQINGIENVLAFRGSCKKLLEILERVRNERRL